MVQSALRPYHSTTTRLTTRLILGLSSLYAHKFSYNRVPIESSSWVQGTPCPIYNYQVSLEITRDSTSSPLWWYIKIPDSYIVVYRTSSTLYPSLQQLQPAATCSPQWRVDRRGVQERVGAPQWRVLDNFKGIDRFNRLTMHGLGCERLRVRVDKGLRKARLMTSSS